MPSGSGTSNAWFALNVVPPRRPRHRRSRQQRLFHDRPPALRRSVPTLYSLLSDLGVRSDVCTILFVDTNNCAQGRDHYSHTLSTYGWNRTLTYPARERTNKLFYTALFIRIRMTNRGLCVIWNIGFPFQGALNPRAVPSRQARPRSAARSRGVMK